MEKTFTVKVTVTAEDERAFEDGYFSVKEVVVDGHEVRSSTGYDWPIYNTPSVGLWVSHLDY